MSRGNPPALPSLKNPQWFLDLLSYFPSPQLHFKFAAQYQAQLKFEEKARDRNPIMMAPAGTEAEQYEHYRQIIETRGFKLDPNAPTVVAMRGISSDGLSHQTEIAGTYGDTFVVLRRDANGDPHVQVLTGSTHPGSQTDSVGGSIGVPDVANRAGVAKKDGRADVGMIVEGEYNLVPRGQHMGAPAWDVRLGNSGVLPGFRDTNQDNVFSATERAASEARNDTLTGVMIHQGFADGPASLGCINVSSAEYDQFTEALEGAKEGGKLIVLDAPGAWPT